MSEKLVLAQNVYDGYHRVMVEAFDSTKPVRITVPVHVVQWSH
jgi:hypothetical protein